MLSKEHVLSDAIPIYRKLASDDQDSVRLLTVEDLIAIASQLEQSEVKEQLLLQVRSSVSDKSWRVRYMVANHFVEVRRFLLLARSLADFEPAGGSCWARHRERRTCSCLCPASERQ